jgi:hypothetical protein
MQIKKIVLKHYDGARAAGIGKDCHIKEKTQRRWVGGCAGGQHILKE